MIQISNLTKKYGDKEVLKELELKIEKGTSVAILGANGAGKTTLVEIIGGIQNKTSGEIIFSKNINERIGIQFQEGVWPPKTRALDLIKFFKGKKWKEDQYTMEIFEVFEIEKILKEDITKLSAGQKQRFNCFLAIINKPTLLILDELITGLDIKMQIKILNYINNLRKRDKITLLIISHIPDEIEQLCERIILLKDGKVVENKTTQEVIKQNGSVRKYMEEFFNNDKS
ncbi:peptide/nickel transport system ATP-binding protein [Spiroplasma clarkii]|uniref:ABC transporter ATP-binding protein n=1 Tax=Spiroplasma clarkii TaxID=2139 RepID=UPI000B55D673|nr:ABC transporter ATP-binding protein [Spiroplasma clarkii]ARU91114.1 peptide/nickel transport system ATP-binding protein [Spiroplasma clarkii]